MAKLYYMSDLSAAAIDEQCGRRFWYHELESGKGIVRPIDQITEALMEATQEDLYTLQTTPTDEMTPGALAETVREILGGLTEEEKGNKDALEVMYRRLGWMAAWALFHESHLRNVYETIPLPRELTLNLDPLQVQIRSGRLLRSKSTKEYIYRYFVPTPVTGQSWRDALYYTPRPHLEMKAVSDYINEPVTICAPVGLLMGYRSRIGNDMSRYALHHPYVTAYKDDRSERWTHNFLIGKEWAELRVWDYPGGVVAWVELCGLDTANAQFALGPRVSYVPRFVDAWQAWRTRRERQVAEIRGECYINPFVRNGHFPQNTTACVPLSGDRCPYTELCWSPSHITSPIFSGKFVARPGWRRVEEVESVAGTVAAS